jgi:hypothetical protein
MVKPIVFFIFVFILIGIIHIKPTEGFANLLGNTWTTKNAGTPSIYNTKENGKVPSLPVAQLGVGSIEPGPPPASDLPTAPAGFHSKESPNPYRNPTNEPAKYIRILAVKEELQAFFGFQAESLESTSDPSIQIPLTRARADLSELIDIQSVMERNPGLASRINNKQLDDMKSNISYLQRSLSDINANGPIKEGFKGSKKSPKAKSGPRANIRELQEFQIKLVVELKRLEASGTSDPLTKARISNLTVIRKDIDDVISKIEKGFYTKDTVPIFKSDIRNSLPLLGNLNKPLPQLLNKFNLPPAIASLFPAGLSPKDNEQAAQINNIVKGYMKQISEGVSWGIDVNIRYDNPNTRKHEPRPDYKTNSKYTITSGIPGINNPGSSTAIGTPINQSTHNTKIPLNYNTNSTYTKGLPGSSNFRIFPDPIVGHLDWKKRSSEIITQIKKRGLRPAQFGAMDPKVEVSKDFSWRGYTRMMCSRLNATTDPGLSTTVGCPPENWIGWRQ